jgi:predicted membrane protein
MRFGFVFNGIFWGGFLIILGLLAIVKAVFHLNISMFRIGFALLIIAIGLSMLVTRPRFHGGNNTVLFGNRQLFLAEQDEYNVIFGQGLIDLSAVNNEPRTRQLEINVVFGEGVIKINPDLPMTIKVSSVFAGAELPDGNRVTMGDYTYRTPNYTEHNGGIRVKANVIFGNLVFRE